MKELGRREKDFTLATTEEFTNVSSSIDRSSEVLSVGDATNGTGVR